MNLSPHFYLEEFSRSSVAKRYGIDNHVPEAYIPHLQALCEHVLEPLRAHINHGPLLISSGYRSPALNSHPAVRGAKNSSHLFGYAADLYVPTVSEGREWFKWIEDNLQFHELIWEVSGKSHWIHVSYIEGKNQNRVISLLKKK